MWRVPSLNKLTLGVLSLPVVAIALAIAMGGAAVSASGCSSKGLCPFPNATSVESVPATPCIEARVETCIEPTLIVKNGCDRALYMPQAFGRVGADAQGDDIEVLPTQSIHFVVRDEKATARSQSRKDFVIPVRLTTQKLDLKFATLGE